MRFSIEFKPEAKKSLKNIPKQFSELIKRAISERLEVDPISYGKPLIYSLWGLRALRTSRYRVIYKVEEAERKVIIVKIDIRRDVYQ